MNKISLYKAIVATVICTITAAILNNLPAVRDFHYDVDTVGFFIIMAFAAGFAMIFLGVLAIAELIRGCNWDGNVIVSAMTLLASAYFASAWPSHVAFSSWNGVMLSILIPTAAWILIEALNRALWGSEEKKV